MNDKSALLDQLRLNRGVSADENPHRALWWVVGGAAALAVLGVGGWLLFGRASGVPVRIAVAQESTSGFAASGASLLDASGYVVARRQATVSSKITGKVLEVLIEDEGHGLSNTSNLFVPFFTTKPGGSGIGLLLSRQIAEAHGGSLDLQNRVDAQGCRARLMLPV